MLLMIVVRFLFHGLVTGKVNARHKRLQWREDLQKVKSQFRQYFTRGFLVRKFSAKLFCTYILGLNFFDACILATMYMLVKLTPDHSCDAFLGFARQQWLEAHRKFLSTKFGNWSSGGCSYF